jgi:hypothetical protein
MIQREKTLNELKAVKRILLAITYITYTPRPHRQLAVAACAEEEEEKTAFSGLS